MKSAILFTTTACAVLLMCGVLGKVAVADNTTAALKSQISAMVTELNSTKAADGSPKSAEAQLQEMTAFIKKYADPLELSAIEEEKGLDKVARDFVTTSRASLVKKLTHISEATPKVSPDRKLYTFLINDPEVSAQPSLVFAYNETTDRFHLKN